MKNINETITTGKTPNQEETEKKGSSKARIWIKQPNSLIETSDRTYRVMENGQLVVVKRNR